MSDPSEVTTCPGCDPKLRQAAACQQCPTCGRGKDEEVCCLNCGKVWAVRTDDMLPTALDSVTCLSLDCGRVWALIANGVSG